MTRTHSQAMIAALAAICIAPLAGQPSSSPAQGQRTGQTAAAQPPDDVRALVERLDLEKYKATIKGLTVFGDRREGTERNRKAVDWIEVQLKSYGCETGRITYDPTAGRGERGGGGQGRAGQGRGGQAAAVKGGVQRNRGARPPARRRIPCAGALAEKDSAAPPGSTATRCDSRTKQSVR